MLSRVRAGSAGTGMGSPGLSVTQRAENVLMKATRSARFCLVRAAQLGMLEVMKPRVMALKRSWSVGSVPVGVERLENGGDEVARGWRDPRLVFAIAIAARAMTTPAVAVKQTFSPRSQSRSQTASCLWRCWRR